MWRNFSVPRRELFGSKGGTFEFLRRKLAICLRMPSFFVSLTRQLDYTPNNYDGLYQANLQDRSRTEQ